MSQPNDSADFLGGGAKYFGFPVVGTTISGTIIDEPITRQQTDPDSGDLKVWKDGSPQLVLVIQLATNLRDPSEPDDDGTRSVWVSIQGMRKAIATAVKATGRKQLDVGGTLTVSYVGDGEKTNPKLNAPKLFTASYVAPNASTAMLADGQGNGAAAYATPSATPAPVPYPQAAPPVYAAPVAAVPYPVAASYQVPAAAAPAPPVQLPPGMTVDVWNQLTPEARTALASITG